MMTERAQLVADYQRLRHALRELNTSLMARFPEGALNECGEQLGLLSRIPGQEKGVLVFDDEYEMSVLMDYCIYHFRRGGRTVIEGALAESPPPPGSDELALLQAMREVRYSLFLVEGVVPGVGVRLRDSLRDERALVVDIGFSRTASAGVVLVGNIISPAGMSMTTGAMLPVDQPILDDLMEQFEKRFGTTTVGQFRQLPPEEQSELATLVIRCCLAGGAASHVRGEDPAVDSRGRRAALSPASPSPRVSRNAPCPCGSGKKYKRCCGRV